MNSVHNQITHRALSSLQTLPLGPIARGRVFLRIEHEMHKRGIAQLQTAICDDNNIFWNAERR
jgi:hypothetical protein